MKKELSIGSVRRRFSKITSVDLKSLLIVMQVAFFGYKVSFYFY